MERAIRRPARDPALSQPRCRPVRPAQRHLVRHPGHLDGLGRRRQPWQVGTEPATPSPPGTSSPARATCRCRRRPSSPVSSRSAVRCTSPETGSTRTSTSPANGSPSSAPAPAASRPSPRSPRPRDTSRSSSARPTTPPRLSTAPPIGCGRRREGRLRPGPRRLAQPLPRRARTPRCSPPRSPCRPRSGAAPSTSAGTRGGFQLFIDSYQDILFDKDANDTIAEYIRERIHERVSDPAVADLLAPEGLSLRHQAPAAGDQLLRGVQPGQRDARRHQDHADRSDHRDRGPHRGRRVRARRHRARHRLRRHDRAADEAGHRRARRAEAVPTSGRDGPRTYLGSRSTTSRTCSSSPARRARRCSTTCRSLSKTTSTSSPTRSPT